MDWCSGSGENVVDQTDVVPVLPRARHFVDRPGEGAMIDHDIGDGRTGRSLDFQGVAIDGRLAAGIVAGTHPDVLNEHVRRLHQQTCPAQRDAGRRRGLTRDRDVWIAHMQVGRQRNRAGHFEHAHPRAALVHAGLEGASAVGIEIGNANHSATATGHRLDTGSLRTGDHGNRARVERCNARGDGGRGEQAVAHSTGRGRMTIRNDRRLLGHQVGPRCLWGLSPYQGTFMAATLQVPRYQHIGEALNAGYRSPRRSVGSFACTRRCVGRYGQSSETGYNRRAPISPTSRKHGFRTGSTTR